jgi:N-acetylglucosamine kinase-like BadF-type ATPase
MHFLGIDSGGSKIKGMLTDLEGSAVRTSVGGAGNIAVLGRKNFKRNLTAVLHEVLAGKSPSIVAHATFGIAGAGRPDEKRLAEKIIGEIGFTDFTVLTDSQLLHYSYFRDGHGVVVASGTGSFCIFRTPSGELKQLGGWGYLLGDEGSGFAIGRDAIREVIRNHESQARPSSLAQGLLSFYGHKRVGELISSVYASLKPQEYVASCAKLVCELASKGDKAAIRIVDVAANSLVDKVQEAREHVENESTCKIALAGGVLSHQPIVRGKLAEKIKSGGFQVEFVDRWLSPRGAALFHAITQADKKAEPNLYAKLEEDLS